MDEGQRRSVCEGILKHIEMYPDASDTLEGIRRWWLTGVAADVEPALLDEVLEEFVSEGLMRRRLLPDGGVIYLSARPGFLRS